MSIATNNGLMDVYAKLLELERKIEEAKESARYRPEYKGFDFTIYLRGIKPLLEDLRASEEYLKNDTFKQMLDIQANRCENHLRKSGFHV